MSVALFRRYRRVDKKKMSYKFNIPVQLVRTKDSVPDGRHEQFFPCIRMPLLICRCMGLLPIEGLRNNNSEASGFTLKSLYSIVYIPSLIIPTVQSVLLVCHLFIKNSHRQAITDFAASIFSYIILLILTRFCMRWNLMVHEIEAIEILLPPIENYKKMATIIKALTIFILIMGFVEYALFIVTSWIVMTECAALNDSTDQLKSYYLFVYQWLYELIPFSYFSGIVCQISVFQSTFLWNYNDILIIVLSIYLNSRFKSFNHILMQKQLSMSSKSFTNWATLQVHYTRISRLVTIVDRNMSPMVLMSYACNLMYIFKQILYIINNMKGPSFIDYTKCSQNQSYNTETVVYVAFSTLHALIKTAFVSFLAARLHTTSREPLNALHTVPASAYNNDMQRLMDQVYYSKVCLTGCKFFSITRGMILAMVATLLTYEIVLFQI